MAGWCKLRLALSPPWTDIAPRTWHSFSIALSQRPPGNARRHVGWLTFCATAPLRDQRCLDATNSIQRGNTYAGLPLLWTGLALNGSRPSCLSWFVGQATARAPLTRALVRHGRSARWTRAAYLPSRLSSIRL